MIQTLARELGQSVTHVQNVVNLLDEGNTIPFIARYRKEMHGSMDDTTLRTLGDRLTYLRNLETRKQEVLTAIENQDKLTPELAAQINRATVLSQVEDLYLPYKQKRRTRATIAKEKGLQPLADAIFAQTGDLSDLTALASDFINADLGVESAEDALAGASDIIAETMSDSAQIRDTLRKLLHSRAALQTVAATEEDSVYQNYYAFSQPIAKLQGHQVLAINRGEKEKLLKVSLAFDHELALHAMAKQFIRKNSPVEEFLTATIADSYQRLLFGALERELRSALTEQASEGAIHNFALNLKPLLMQPPVKGHVTMGLDPGFRRGCKVAVVDATGKVLDTTVVYPTHGAKQELACIQKLTAMIRAHHVEHIAIGNGTASRETEQMAVKMMADLSGVSYMMVNEAGASVYSASKLAAEEFPQYDVNLRSAVSIARRMQDPLAELVKIDPKAIGVGQYQHDMPQKRLDETLSGVVEDCVNAVGVDLNTASPSLLARVSGLNGTTAKNVVVYREENGAFTARAQIKKVPKLGPKAYQQCAGFLRVAESKSPLDGTGVHPESYPAAEKLLQLCGYQLADVAGDGVAELSTRVQEMGQASLAKQCDIGVPTLQDIVAELLKPGRDPRDELPAPILRTDILDMKDLKVGMQMNGTVRNVIDFGVFVDIGVHQDGLVHISQICNRFIRHPSEVLSVGDVVNVVVINLDLNKKRIGLSIKQADAKK